MADPILRASWLDPLGVRLEFDFDGSGDAQVWWRDSTPQNQEYRKLGTANQRTLDVSPLNWSTFYWFRYRTALRDVYSDWSNVLKVFCACNQVFVEGAPPDIPTTPEITNVSYWQQSADPSGDGIAFCFRNLSHYLHYLVERTKYFDALDPETELEGWLYRFASDYETPYRLESGWGENAGTFMPVAVRNVGGNIATLDGVWWAGQVNNFGYYYFRFWDGVELFQTQLGPPPFFEYYRADYFREFNPCYRSLPYSMEFDGENKIVVCMMMLDWYGNILDYGDDYIGIVVQESYDRGRTWGPEIVAARLDESSYTIGTCAMAPAGDGSYFIVATGWVDGIQQGYWGPAIYAKVAYPVYKYVSGQGSTLVRTIVSNLQDDYSWDGDSYYLYQGVYYKWYDRDSFDTQARSCVIASEGNKLAIAYNDEIDQLTGDPTYHAHVKVKVDVSNNNGASWLTHTVGIPGEDYYWNLQWLSLLPTITISNGSLIMYLCVGTTGPDEYRIIKSDTDGASWRTVFDFPGVTIEIPWVFQLRADGDHVTLTGCKASIPDDTLALWESTDGGETWVAESIVLDNPTLLLTATG